MSLLLAIDLLARFLHVISVIVWMGHNYANVVQHPRYRQLVPEETARPDAIWLAASKREHAIFRWSSLVVLLTGVYLLFRRGDLLEALMLSGPHAVIGIGVWTGTLMVLNLWLVLWPHQKKVLGFVDASTKERIACTRITFLSSRTNTILSIPTLFFMIAGAHATHLFI